MSGSFSITATLIDHGDTNFFTFSSQIEGTLTTTCTPSLRHPRQFRFCPGSALLDASLHDRLLLGQVEYRFGKQQHE
jgi:hypothetical protein